MLWSDHGVNPLFKKVAFDFEQKCCGMHHNGVKPISKNVAVNQKCSYNNPVKPMFKNVAFY